MNQSLEAIGNVEVKKKRSSNFMRLQTFGIWYTLVILLIIGSLTSNHFFTIDNLLNIVRQTAVVGLLAMGMTIVIISGALDFTLGTIVALTSVIIGSMQNFSPFITIPVLIFVAISIGLLNSFVVTRLRLESFVATLGVSLFIEAVAHFISNSQAIPVASAGWRLLGSGNVFTIPLPIIIFIVLGSLLHFQLKRTVFGRYLYATGGNSLAARISGVPTQKIQTYAFLIAAAIAVISGIIFTGRIASGDPNIGLNLTLDAVIVSVLGGAALTGGKGSILGAVAGALLITVLFNIFNMLNFPLYAQMIARGFILIAAIAIQRR